MAGESDDGHRQRVRAAGERVRAEAAARRKAAIEAAPAEKIDGRGGMEPVRYGDWEVKGIASDF